MSRKCLPARSLVQGKNGENLTVGRENTLYCDPSGSFRPLLLMIMVDT
jgi:hypothetical protein